MRKIKAVLLALALTLGLMGVSAIPASAGYGTGATTCAALTGLGNRVCWDASTGVVTVYSSATTVYASWSTGVSGRAAPSGGGWIANDYECNPQVNSTGTWEMYVSYPLSSSPTHWFTNAYGYNSTGHWFMWGLTRSQMDVLAWITNSGTGYECVLIP